MKNLTKANRLRDGDKKMVLAKLDRLNKDLNKVEIYIGKKNNLTKIQNELNNDLAHLSNYSKPFTGLNYMDSLTTIPFSTLKTLAAQYLFSGLIFIIMLGFYRSRAGKLHNSLFAHGDQATALLNKKGLFIDINDSFKAILPFNKFSLLRNLNWSSFEKLARVDFKNPIKDVKSPLVTSASFTIDEETHKFMARLTPNKKLKGYVLTLTPALEVETYNELSAIPDFSPPEIKEEVHLSHILEDVVAEHSILFQSKQVELHLKVKGDNHVLTGNIDKTHLAFSTFIRDMVLALAPKSKTKSFTLTLEETLDGITLHASMDDVKLATPILKSNFKFEEEGKTKKRNLNQGIEVLK